jgi:hypothetical protein
MRSMVEGHANAGQNIQPRTRVAPCKKLAGDCALASSTETEAARLTLSPAAPDRTLYFSISIALRRGWRSRWMGWHTIPPLKRGMMSIAGHGLRNKG